VSMKMSGVIRRTDEKTGGFSAGRQSPLLIALANGTALPGADAHHSAPGNLYAVGPPEVLCRSQVRSSRYSCLILRFPGTEVSLGSFEERVL
jgi:hypothetical protein